MDFFESQEAARRKSGLLIFYYVTAVVLIILGVYTVFSLLINANGNGFWDPALFLYVGGGTLLVIASGTLYKVSQLSAGGSKVAELLGGKPVDPHTIEPAERMLINIVEEMSIASGLPVPQIYILDREKAINAFASGLTPDDAVIGVTRGSLESFSRDEMQGVIAHEFSHIQYGDMQLNIKLMGVLHGILIIALTGYALLRSSLYRRSFGQRSRDNRMPVILLGLALAAIGYIGVLFGNIIKSAVSRQREYLADAAAVQFTRNPAGIAGALKKIAGLPAGSEVRSSHAQEASHLFFSNGVRSALMNLMATHPPVRERIKRLDPSFREEDIQAESLLEETGGAAEDISGEKRSIRVRPEEILATAGTILPEHLEYASEVIRNIPDNLLKFAHDLPGAEAVVYALLLSRDDMIKAGQIQKIRQKTSPEAFSITNIISAEAFSLREEYRIPLLDLAISSLKKDTRESYLRFSSNIRTLIEADGKVSLFEYMVRTMLLRHLGPAFSRPHPPTVMYRTLRSLKPECRLILSLLAHYGVDEESEKSAAFAKGAGKTGVIDPGSLLPKDKCRFKDLEKILGKLALTAPLLKKQLLDACITCVASDGYITVRQAELIRATADTLGCPIPPVLPGKIQG